MTASASAVSVVLATHQRRTLLERTLDALRAQTVSDFRVVVVDDGSTDGTWEWLEARAGEWSSPRLAIARQERMGQGAARNLGLRSVAEGLVLFIGDDIIAAPDFVAAHLAAHQGAQESCAVVGFTDWRRSEMRVTPALEMVNREGHQFGYGHMEPGGEVPFACFYTSNVSVPRAVLADRPFDESFTAYGWEDVDLGYRLCREGVRIFYHPEARAEHLHAMDLRSLFQRQLKVGRGLHTLLALHPELDGDPHLSPPTPPWWFPIGRRMIPPLVPLLSTVDHLRLPLSRRLLHAVLMCGYYMGQEESR